MPSIKHEHDVLSAPEVRERQRTAFPLLEREIRRACADSHASRVERRKSRAASVGRSRVCVEDFVSLA